LSVLAEADTHIHLPDYQGGTLRGTFGHALKESVCTFENKECEDCLARHQCPYSYAFETPLPENARTLRNVPYLPHPFIITPMTQGAGTHLPGNQLRFGLTLIGRAIDHLPYFVLALERMGRRGLGKGRGRFRPVQINALGSAGKAAETLFDGADLRVPETILGYKDAVRLAESHPKDEAAVVFKTPFRVKHQGRLTDSPEFHILIRTLLRRLGNLVQFHCDCRIDLPYKDIIRAAEAGRIDLPYKDIIRAAEAVALAENHTRWHDWTRYSGRQHKKMKMGGMVGRAVYRGDLSVFLPMLVMGTWVNVGKGTGMGLGSYRLAKQNLTTDEDECYG